MGGRRLVSRAEGSLSPDPARRRTRRPAPKGRRRRSPAPMGGRCRNAAAHPPCCCGPPPSTHRGTRGPPAQGQRRPGAATRVALHPNVAAAAHHIPWAGGAAIPLHARVLVAARHRRRAAARVAPPLKVSIGDAPPHASPCPQTSRPRWLPPLLCERYRNIPPRLRCCCEAPPPTGRGTRRPPAQCQRRRHSATCIGKPPNHSSPLLSTAAAPAQGQRQRGATTRVAKPPNQSWPLATTVAVRVMPQSSVLPALLLLPAAVDGPRHASPPLPRSALATRRHTRRQTRKGRRHCW